MISSNAVSVNGLGAMRYESVIRGPEGAFHHTLIVFDKPDAEGRRLTFMFETPEATATAMRPSFDKIIGSIEIGQPSGVVADIDKVPSTQKPPQPVEKQKILFAGNGFGNDWEQRLETKRRASFEDVAKFESGTLRINVPKGKSWGQVGLSSKRPLVWLDHFGPGAEKQLTFKIDPARTTGVAIALSTSNEKKTVVVKWVRLVSENKTVLQIFVNSGLACNPDWPVHAKPAWQQEVASQPPEQLVLALTPGHVQVSGGTLPTHTQKWATATSDVGFRIHAYSFPESYDGPAKMALREIVLEDKVLKSVEPPKPLAGVAPLPVTELFGPAHRTGWQLTPWETGNAADKRCVLDDKGFSVLRGPSDGSSTNGCDLHSQAQIVTLDDRLRNAVYELTAQFTPMNTHGFRVVLPTRTRGNQRWVKSLSTREILLVRSTDDPANMTLNCANQAQRDVSNGWLRNSWNGKLTITIGEGWMRCSLGGSMAVRVNTAPADSFYIYVVAPDYHFKGTDPRLRLTRITGQWTLLHPMTAAERWRYLDDDKFDPQAFIADLDALVNTPADVKTDNLPDLFIDIPNVRQQKREQPRYKKSGSIWDWLNPISTAHAAPDCAKEIDQYIDEKRRFEATLAVQPDLVKSFANLGFNILGLNIGKDGSKLKVAREMAVKSITAVQDGVAIGKDWKAGDKQAFVGHIMQAALKIGLNSGNLNQTYKFRQGVDHAVRKNWVAITKSMPEHQAKAFLKRVARMFKTTEKIDPNMVYKDILAKGTNFDLGKLIGTSASGTEHGRKLASAMVWTFSDSALSTFVPKYNALKAAAETTLDMVKAQKAFVVNDRVNSMYDVWKEEFKENAGMNAKDFYNARTITGDRLPLAEVKKMLGNSPTNPISDEAAEKRLFALYKQWYAAEETAKKKGDRLSRLKQRFQKLDCKADLAQAT
ncbi:MAG: hypothetical protein P8Y47_12735, partial [Alphaproteobacteria bacterium]